MTEDEAIRAVAAREWGSHLERAEPHVGFNRRSWRVGERLWITGMDVARRELLERENRLLERLESAVREAGVSLEVPHVVPARSGATVVEEDSWCFRATGHLTGERADGDAQATYVEAARAFRVLHAALRTVPDELAVMPPFLGEVESTIERSLGTEWSGVTRDAGEQDLVCTVAELLVTRLPRLQQLPCQLTHGDWSIPNWLVEETGEITVVLDWQMATLAPPIVDLAQVFSGVLMFSTLAMSEVAPAIELAYGPEAQTELLSTAMVAYWFRNYWSLRDELERDPRAGGGVGGVERQPGRLRAVLAYSGWSG
jgi:aminoglycoside phosphotransferase (APT) family kinase protein